MVLLVATAGCSAGPLGGSDAGDGGDGGDDAGEGDDSGESSGDDGSGDSESSDGESSSGDSESGDGGGATTTSGSGAAVTGDVLTSSIVDRHVEYIQSAGSVTAEMRGITTSSSGMSSSQGNSSPPVIDWTMKMDLTTGEHYANGSIESSTSDESTPIELYSPPNSEQAYTRMTFQGQSQVTQADSFDNVADPGNSGLFGAVRLTRDGTQTLNGQTYARYTAENADAVTDSAHFDGAVENLQMEVLVDEQTGFIAMIEYDYEVTSGDTTTNSNLRLRYTNVGSTTVERPDWMDEVEG